MKETRARFTGGLLLLTCMLLALAAPLASAGGPVCPPRCMPPMCAPPPCAPPPMCGPPAMCPPPMCPPPMCGPKPCPPRCEDDPLTMIVKGTFRLVAGVVSLPFKLVDCLCRPSCPPPCGPRVACCPPPPMCPPPSCMMPGCGMGCCPPGMGMGMGPMGPPAGFGRPGHRPVRPMAKAKDKALPVQLLAGPSEGVFGEYW
jgi:hypothetical protein